MKNCLKCGKPFEPKRKEQKYCHHKCSVNPQWGWGGGKYGGFKSSNLVERKHMPNHVTNKIKFTTKTYEEIGKDVFDYENEQMSKLFDIAFNPERHFDFNAFIKMPDNSDTFYAGDSLGEEERKKYGKNNWYDWAIESWGTKWNAYSVVWSVYDVMFQTAWSIPMPVFIELSKRFPEEQITIEYADENIGYNCGILVVRNGSIINHRNDKNIDDYTDWERFASELCDEHRSDEHYLETRLMRDKLMEFGVANVSEWEYEAKSNKFKSIFAKDSQVYSLLVTKDFDKTNPRVELDVQENN